MPRILIAEDESHIARVMTMWLSRHGFEVIDRPHGVAALETLRHEPVDLIISDMNMPQLDGLGLAEAVRVELKLEVPFILITARCDQVALGKKLEPFRVKIFPKPFVPSRLVALIERLLAPAGAQAEES